MAADAEAASPERLAQAIETYLTDHPAAALLESLSDADLRKGYNHPERGREMLVKVLAMYDWHSRHHTAHITSLRMRMGW